MAGDVQKKYCMLCSVGTSAITNLVAFKEEAGDSSEWKSRKERTLKSMEEFAQSSQKEREIFPKELLDFYGYTAFQRNGKWPEEAGTLKPKRPDKDSGNRETLIGFLQEAPEFSGSIKPRECLKGFMKGGFPSAESNSVIRWLAQKSLEAREKGEIFSCTVYFFPGENLDARFGAWASHMWIEAASKIGLFGPQGQVQIAVEVRPPLTFEVQTPDAMRRGVSALFEGFEKMRKKAEDAGETVLINATGGYKVISGFSLLYAQVHALPCLYIYEEDDDVLELQALPLGFAVGALDEEIGFLKGLKALYEEDLLEEEMFEKLPPWVQGLLLKKETPEGEKKKYEISSLATTLIKHFEENRRKNTGVGRRLLDMLEEKDTSGSRLGGQLRKYLEERIQNEWGELWMGDQIPETVEHSRRHSKRLMEIGGHLLESSRDILEKENLLEPLPLALLISSIYLHDIGHTALGFPVDTGKDAKCAEEGSFPLGMFPTAVREVHHLLSRDMIRGEIEKLFPKNDTVLLPPEMVDILRSLVPDITAYHRGYTRLTPKDGVKTAAYRDSLREKKSAIAETGELLYGAEGFQESLISLQEILGKKGLKSGEDGGWGVTLEQALGVTGLLRFIDGCDVQADRVIDEAYLKARLERTRYEAQMLEKQVDPFRKLLEGIPGYKNKGKNLWDFLQDLGRQCEKIDFSQAKKGTIPKETQDVVKEATNNVYPAIFRKLGDIKAASGACGFSSLLSPEKEERCALLLALSLANRIAFKWEQFLHFHKHWGVKYVLPCKEKGKPLVLLQGAGNLEDVVGDMKGELEKVREFDVLTTLDVSIRKSKGEIN